MLEQALQDLKVFNSIVFEESEHKYLINGQLSAKYSVTGLISKYKPKFDEDKWARLKAKKLGISVDEMKFIWSEKNLYSTTLGTALHQIIENTYTKQPYNLNTTDAFKKLGENAYTTFKKEIFELTKQFVSFFESTREYLIPVSNELIIGDIQQSMICGTLDMLAFNKKTNTYEIYDFKTNKAISYSSQYGDFFLPPLNNLEVCEYNTYSLQLSIYQYILEKYTNLKISELNIVWFNTQNTTYKIIPCKKITKYAELILNQSKL
jgi:hypothetical protein